MTNSIIDAAWDRYRIMVIPANAPDTQIRECKRAFYAGASEAITQAARIGNDDVTEAQGIATMQTMFAECDRFCEAVKRGNA